MSEVTTPTGDAPEAVLSENPSTEATEVGASESATTNDVSATSVLSEDAENKSPEVSRAKYQRIIIKRWETMEQSLNTIRIQMHNATEDLRQLEDVRQFGLHHTGMTEAFYSALRNLSLLQSGVIPVELDDEPKIEVVRNKIITSVR